MKNDRLFLVLSRTSALALVALGSLRGASAETFREPPDFAGAYFNSPYTNLGTLTGATMIEGSLPPANGGDADVVVFTTSVPISQVTVNATAGISGTFEISLGAGTDSRFAPLGGGEIFSNPKLVSPGAHVLLTTPLPPGTYFLGLSDGHPQTVVYSVEIETDNGPAPLPPLEIEVEGETVTLSWPVTSTQWQLHKSDDLQAWLPVEEEVVASGGRNQVELVVDPEEPGFFRLEGSG